MLTNKCANELNRQFKTIETGMITILKGAGYLRRGIAHQNYFGIPPHPVRMAVIKRFYSECWQGCGERGALIHCWWGVI